MKIAYLVNQYPKTSHTFIRREIAAIEAQGLAIDRFAIRVSDEPLVDEADEAERQRTRVVLGVGATGLLWGLLATVVSRPLGFLRALATALRLGRRSERGRLVHLIYLAEACVLRSWLAGCGTQHLHAHFGTNSAAVSMLCRLVGGPPYSFTIHGPTEFDSPQALSLGEKIRHAAFVVAISEFGKSQAYRWSDYDDWSKIHVVRCGLDEAFFAADPPPPPASDVPRLVCVGRLVEQKGQLLLVEAAARLRDRGVPFELMLVGDGPLRAGLDRLIGRLELQAQVRITGWMSGEEVRGEILASCAMVLPSFAEGLPVVLMEALALGRPVISTYVAGIPELVQPGVCGWLVPPGSVEALAEAMHEALAADTNDLERMGRAGASRVAGWHNARIEADRLVNLISIPYSRWESDRRIEAVIG